MSKDPRGLAQPVKVKKIEVRPLPAAKPTGKCLGAHVLSRPCC
jgi:hypothetical protein